MNLPRSTRYRALLALPWILAAVAAVLYIAVVPHERNLGRLWNCALKSAAATGCFLAFASYRRGDYLRVAWAALGVSFVALALRDLLAFLGLLGDGFAALNLAQIVANGFGLVAFVGFARAFRVAGLRLPIPVATQALVYMACAGLGVGIAGYALAQHIAELGRTDIAVVGAIASDLGDLGALVLLAPILLTSLALRGGLLGRPWLFLTAAQICWLLYDVFALADSRVAREVSRALACGFSLAAGLAQRWLADEARAADEV